MARRMVSIVITTVAIAAIVAHLLRPALAIDVIALVLVGIAILPWLGPILESIELPGGFKATLREVKDATLREVEKTTQEAKATAQAALSRSEEVHQTAQATLSETRAVKEVAQALLSQTQVVKEVARATLSETHAVKEQTQAVKETAQAALFHSAEIDKKVSEEP
jgi:methyl-accepting chemotaxis protein